MKSDAHHGVMVQVSERLNPHSTSKTNHCSDAAGVVTVQAAVWFDWFWFLVGPETLDTLKQRSPFFLIVIHYCIIIV